MKILICDDKLAEAEKTKRAIDSRADVELLAGENLKKALPPFLDSVTSVLKGDAGAESKFDGYDILIVDNNLTELQLDGARLTAETIIGYLRAFTNTPYIISLNKNPHVDFDLRYLFGDYQSLADLALNTKHLSSHRLWGGKSDGDFAPWYWPHLEVAVARRKEQNVFVAKNFERKVWESFGFPDEADEYLSLRAKSLLSSEKFKVWESTFEVFFGSSRVLPLAEKNRLKELATEQVELARRAVHQISAYEIDRWLRRDVLGTQDVLIDLPHLLAQMPFLLGVKANNLSHWNEVLECEQPAYGLDEQLFRTYLSAASFSHNMWVPGPCFWWPTLKSDEALTELFFAAEDDGWPNAVFCEDVSRFVSVTGAEDPPQEFEAEIEGSWIRRYIAQLRRYLYSPSSRIIGSAS